MDNNSDMKTPYEVRPEGTSTILAEIAMQHMQSTSYYRDIAQGMQSKDDTAAGYFSSLADYHDGMLRQVNQILEDVSAGVNTPSHSSESYIRGQQAAINRALQSGNVVELAEIAYDNEQEVSKAYEQALANSNLLEFAEKLLHDQHQKILIWVNRADRYKTVPQEFNDHYDED